MPTNGSQIDLALKTGKLLYAEVMNNSHAVLITGLTENGNGYVFYDPVLEEELSFSKIELFSRLIIINGTKK